MYLQAFPANDPTTPSRVWISSIGALWAGGGALAIIVATIVTCAGRTPFSAPLSDLNIERELLAGSDALLERMVIPPNRPDWVLSQCADLESTGSTYDQIRKVVCEVSRHESRN